MDDSLKVADWKWNVWEVDLKTGRLKKWLGMISDPKTGFAWLKTQGKDAKKYRINNVPPEASANQNPPREVYETSDGKRHVGDTLPRKPEKGTASQRRAEDAAVKQARKAADKAVMTRVPKAPKPKDTKEMQKIKADAADLLKKHKADEQAELEQDKG